jgi:hypothetical protein
VRKPNIKLEYPEEYAAWQNMIQRCTNPKRKNYHNYGGRGIKVWIGWINSFQNFLNYIGLKPGPEYTLERLNNDGNYEPGNIKWATQLEQAHNKRARKNNILNKEDVDEIRRAYSKGAYTQIELARMFNVSQMHISNIINNLYWKE